jgi:hypothetical protein
VLIPIEGGVYDPVEVSYRATQSVDTDAEVKPQALASQSQEIHGEHLNWARVTAESGFGVEDIGLQAAAVGHTGTVDGDTVAAAVMALTVHAEQFRAAALQATISSQTAANSRVARATVDVLRSVDVLDAARQSVLVNSEVVRRMGLGLTVQNTFLTSGRISVEAAQHNVYTMRQALGLGGEVVTLARIAADVTNGDSMLILADILEEAVSDMSEIGPQGFYAVQEINARLVVSGSEIPITSFSYEEPDGKLGAMLNLTLARVSDRPSVPVAMSLSFDLLITNSDGDVRAIPLVQNGKIGGREFTITWRGNGPGDELTISAIDIAEDKFGLAPRRPVTMFDPTFVQYANVAVRARDAILDEAGQPILPILEPVEGLTFLQAAQRAYTSMNGTNFMSKLSPATSAGLVKVATLIGGNGESETTVGLGFSRVVTNIADYPIQRADFTVESGWHDGALPFVGMFDPVYFVVGQDLFIMDAERRLPTGFSTRVVPTSNYMLMSVSTPYRDPYNAVILTHQVRGSDSEYDGLTLREEVEQTTDRNGTYGSEGYQEVRHYTKFQRKYDESGTMVEEVVLQVKDETFVALAGGGGTLTHTSTETQQDFYTNDLKTGHDRQVDSLVLVGPEASLELREVLREKCEISWMDNPLNPGQKIQARNFTAVSGLVYESDETQEVMSASGSMDEQPIRTPVALAQKGGIITDGGSLKFMAIKTISETLRAKTGTTLDVVVVEQDLLTGQYNRGSIAPRTGTSSTNQYETRSRSILLRNKTGNGASEDVIGPRIPISVNAGELPKDRALELGQRVLARGADPRDAYRMNLPGVDFAVHRGSVIRGLLRDGSLTGDFLVRGLTITGQNLGQQGTHRISMSLQGVELPTT